MEEPFMPRARIVELGSLGNSWKLGQGTGTRLWFWIPGFAASDVDLGGG